MTTKKNFEILKCVSLVETGRPVLRTRSYALLLGCTLYASVFQPFWVHGTLNDLKNLVTPLLS